MGVLTILLLGCHIDYIQNDRISTAINFINTQYKNFDVNWVLTGGIKYEIQKLSNNLNQLKWLITLKII